MDGIVVEISRVQYGAQKGWKGRGETEEAGKSGCLRGIQKEKDRSKVQKRPHEMSSTNSVPQSKNTTDSRKEGGRGRHSKKTT